MASSKSVLRLFTQPLQITAHTSQPSATLRATRRQLHQSSIRQRRTPQPLFYQCPSRATVVTPSSWTHQSPQSNVAAQSPNQRQAHHHQRRHQSSTSSISSPSSQPSSAASPSHPPTTSNGDTTRQLPTLQELEAQRAAQKQGATSQSVDVSAAKPEYLLQFTCKECTERSTHKVSKQAYHGGTVLVQCPGCKVRHLVADHLGIFSDKRVTLEDIMKEEGETVRTGRAELKFVPAGEGVVEVQKDGSGVAVS